MINKAGKTVQPTIGAFQAAALERRLGQGAKNYYVILTDQPGDASWPITAATFILMHKDATDKAASKEAIKFFKWSFEKGDKMAEELDYIPMPESVVKLIEKTWAPRSRAETDRSAVPRAPSFRGASEASAPGIRYFPMRIPRVWSFGPSRNDAGQIVSELARSVSDIFPALK